MSTITKQWTFTVATDSDASKVNQNFDDIIDYLNGEVITRDGATQFTGIPSVPATDPTTDNQLTRKKYVDTVAKQIQLLAKDQTMAGAFAPAVTTGGYKMIAGNFTGLVATGGSGPYLAVTFPGGGFTNGVLVVVPVCSYGPNRGTGPQWLGTVTKNGFDVGMPGSTVSGAAGIAYIAIGW